jgi:uncharacterized circularly permuted ATP-grasp superfamily protein
MLIVNSFPSSLVAENKRTLAILLNPKIRQYFTMEENEAIDQLLPLTYSFTNKNDNKELQQEIMKNKNKYVIKRTIDTRGRGVWVGANCSQYEWNKLVHQSIGGPYIVQEYIPHQQDEVYSAENQPVLSNMYSNMAIFIISGKPAGLIARASRDVITNVGKSGCFRPVFII